MKTSLLLAALLPLPVVLLTAGASPSARDSSAAANTPADGARYPRLEALRARALEKFDADHDGRLSESERSSAKSAFREKICARRAGRFERLDQNKDGQISRAEWDSAAAQARSSRAAQGIRSRLREKFDSDHDGRPERLQARAALREWLMK